MMATNTSGGLSSPNRRRVGVGLVTTVAAALTSANACAQPGSAVCDRATPFAEIPADPEAAPLRVEGQVFRADGETPVRGVLIYAHHTGANGLYEGSGPVQAPRRQAFMRTDSDGRFVVRTGMPAAYPNRTQPAHIHLHLWGENVPHQWTDDVLFADDALLSELVRRRSADAGRFAWASAAPVENGERVVRRAIRLKSRGDRFDPDMRFGLRTCGAP